MPSAKSKLNKFLAAIYNVGINRAVNVPEEVGDALGVAAYVPVIAAIGGQTARTTLVPTGNGSYRLYLNTRLRKAAAADTGCVVNVALKLDLQSRELPVPAELRAALRRSPPARKVFHEITPALHREFLRWVHAAKTPETRERRIRRGLQTLRVRAKNRRHSGISRKRQGQRKPEQGKRR